MSKAILAAIVWPLCMLFFAWYAGTVLSLLWLWYVAPHGLVALTWKQCGMAYLAYRVTQIKKPTAEPVDTRTPSEVVIEGAAAITFPAIVLLVGWWLK